MNFKDAKEDKFMDELVSVIIPAYNTESYIGDTIDCLKMQTYKNLQIIFIDDGSSDNTANLIKDFQADDQRVEYYYQTNKGVSAARNYGLKKVVGEKIFFFDSDDTFEPDLIEAVMSYANQNKVASVISLYMGMQIKLTEES